MVIRGALKKDQFGFSMPANAPLYPRPPYVYQNATLMIFKYVTDGKTAAQLIPDALELADPPTAGLVFASYPMSSLGPYDEVVQFVDVVYQKQKFQYAAHLYVTSDAAMASGREMGGYPKKMARIEFLPGSAVTATMDRPSGLRICTGTMRPEVRVPAPMPMDLDYLTLRIIPSPQLDAPPTVAELLQTRWSITSGEVWTGPGSCQLTGASALDPLHQVPVVQPIVCELIRGELRVAPNERPQSDPV